MNTSDVKIRNYKQQMRVLHFPPAFVLKRFWPVQDVTETDRRFRIKLDISDIVGWDTTPLAFNVTYGRKSPDVIVECVGNACVEKVHYGFQTFFELIGEIEVGGKPCGPDLSFGGTETKNVVITYNSELLISENLRRSARELTGDFQMFDRKFPHAFATIYRKNGDQKKCVVTKNGKVNVAGLQDHTDITSVQRQLYHINQKLTPVRGIFTESFKKSTINSKIHDSRIHEERKLVNMMFGFTPRHFNVSEIRSKNEKRRTRDTTSLFIGGVYPSLSFYLDKQRTQRETFSEGYVKSSLRM